MGRRPPSRPRARRRAQGKRRRLGAETEAQRIGRLARERAAETVLAEAARALRVYNAERDDIDAGTYFRAPLLAVVAVAFGDSTNEPNRNRQPDEEVTGPVRARPQHEEQPSNRS
jgi:hypothetical protein